MPMLDGHVRNTSCDPIEGASVYGYVSGPELASRLTDKNGYFAFESVSPGNHLIRGNAPGYVMEAKSVQISSSMLQQSVCDFVLRKSDSSLSGRLFDEENRPMEAEVFLYQNKIVLMKTRSLTEDGTFSFPDLAESRYELTAHSLCHKLGSWSGPVKGEINVTLTLPVIEDCITTYRCDVCEQIKQVKYCRFCHAYICADCKHNYPERIKAMLRVRFLKIGKNPEEFREDYEHELSQALSDHRCCH